METHDSKFAVLGDLSVETLRASGSLKWSLFPEKINGHQTLPCFVAEMDFLPPKTIRDALATWASQGPLGYTPPRILNGFQSAIAGFYQHQGLELSASQVRPVSDLVTMFDAVVRIFTDPEDPITLLTPTYMNFVGHPFTTERTVKHVDMLPPASPEGEWTVDWDALETALDGGGLLVLVNPHNPLGKVYTKEELVRIAELAAEHGVRVFADEIHSPLCYAPHQHVPFASVSPIAAQVALTAFAATKAFSIPGTKASALILTNPDDLRLWKQYAEHLEFGTATSGFVATAAGLTSAAPWLNTAKEYLRTNRDLVFELVQTHLPGAKFHLPEATYLAWLDLTGTPNYETVAEQVTANRSLSNVVAAKCGVIATDGAECGSAGIGHLRINFATGSAVVEEIIRRLGQVFCEAPRE